jgi:predicted aldo/keto reductase-like oxidoreductase
MDELRARDKLTVKQAAIRWALGNPHVCSVLTSVSNFQQIQEFCAAAGGALTTRQSRLLEQYRQQFGDRYCRYCGQCAPLCPMGVDVDAVMRYAMYHQYYAAPHEAQRLYRRLQPHQRAGPCAGCAGPCQAGCPYGLAVREQLAQAHQRLSGGLA